MIGWLRYGYGYMYGVRACKAHGAGGAWLLGAARRPLGCVLRHGLPSGSGVKRSLEQQATIVPRDGAYGLLEAFSKPGSKLLLLLLLAPAEEGCHSSRLRRC